jgi:hypothetical protein
MFFVGTLGIESLSPIITKYELFSALTLGHTSYSKKRESSECLNQFQLFRE